MTNTERAEIIKRKILVEDYVYDIIVPNERDYYSLHNPNFEVDHRFLCPVHDEDTPSARVFPESNSWSCFGCKAGGSTIDLHMLYQEKRSGEKPTLHETLKFLEDYFISGHKDTKQHPKMRTKTDAEKLNSNLDLAKVNKKLTLLETILQANNSSIRMEVQKEIYDKLDRVYTLLNKDLILVEDVNIIIKEIYGEVEKETINQR